MNAGRVDGQSAAESVAEILTYEDGGRFGVAGIDALTMAQMAARKAWGRAAHAVMISNSIRSVGPGERIPAANALVFAPPTRTRAVFSGVFGGCSEPTALNPAASST